MKKCNFIAITSLLGVVLLLSGCGEGVSASGISSNTGNIGIDVLVVLSVVFLLYSGKKLIDLMFERLKLKMTAQIKAETESGKPQKFSLKKVTLAFVGTLVVLAGSLYLINMPESDSGPDAKERAYEMELDGYDNRDAALQEKYEQMRDYQDEIERIKYDMEQLMQEIEEEE